MDEKLKRLMATLLLVSMILTSNGLATFAATMVSVVSDTNASEESDSTSSLFVAKTKEAGSYFEKFGSLYHYESTTLLYNTPNNQNNEDVEDLGSDERSSELDTSSDEHLSEPDTSSDEHLSEPDTSRGERLSEPAEEDLEEAYADEETIDDPSNVNDEDSSGDEHSSEPDTSRGDLSSEPAEETLDETTLAELETTTEEEGASNAESTSPSEESISPSENETNVTSANDDIATPSETIEEVPIELELKSKRKSTESVV